MPRIPRGETRSLLLHILNRGNARATVFHRAGDYRAFIAAMMEARALAGVKLYAFCVMPNYFHLLAEGESARHLSDFTQRWMTAHVRQHHQVHEVSGHLWQGRYKSFPVQADVHLLAVARYILLNPVRASLVGHAHAWPWSSLHYSRLMDAWPTVPPVDLRSWLADGVTAPEVARIRSCIRKRTPYGDSAFSGRVLATPCPE